MNAHGKTCVVTGANGWLGRCVVAELQRSGWQVRKAVRHPTPDAVANGEQVAFHLGEPVPLEVCAGASALVHCAYDFEARTRDEICAKNVQGTSQLLAAAQTAGIAQIVVISTMSAFDGCISLYGRAKLAIENIALQAGALVVRPGLIYGENAGGMFGRLLAQVRQGRMLPLFGGGAQRLYLIHERDLAGFIQRYCAGEIAQPARPLTASHPQPWTFREILAAIARGLGIKPIFYPLPWRLVWAALCCAEAAGARLKFRSDSLVSLMNQNPRPDFSQNAQFGLECRPFKIEEVMRNPPLT
jgi:nucleoside-diphosphate-sugar epimerase